MLEQYFKDLHKAAAHGDTREETYYPVLKTFLELFAQEKTKRKAEVTLLPQSHRSRQSRSELVELKSKYGY